MSSSTSTKIVIVGDSGVGKTNLLMKFVHNKFSTSTQSTIGMDFVDKDVDINGEKRKFLFWDTAGQDRFRAVGGAKGAIVVYDITSTETFQNIHKWISELEKEVPGIPVVLLGNKTDLMGRMVGSKEGENAALNLKFDFFETSAKDGNNVAEAFECIMNKSLEEREEEERREIQQESTVKINPVKKTEVKTSGSSGGGGGSGCCSSSSY